MRPIFFHREKKQVAQDVAQLVEAKQSPSPEPHPMQGTHWVWRQGQSSQHLEGGSLRVRKDLKVILGSIEGSRDSLGYMRPCPRMILNS